MALLFAGLWFFNREPPPQPTTSAATALPPALPPAVVAPPAEATLAFAITPWGEVYVDGDKKGVTPPLKELKLAAGKHMVEIRNAGFTPYVEKFELQAGASHKIKHLFK
jgi:serine/threonine-protein kinase